MFSRGQPLGVEEHLGLGKGGLVRQLHAEARGESKARHIRPLAGVQGMEAHFLHPMLYLIFSAFSLRPASPPFLVKALVIASGTSNFES